MKQNNYPTRLAHLKQTLTQQAYSGMIVSKQSNLTYLTGLRQHHPVNREALLFLTTQSALLYHSAFMTPPTQHGITALAMRDPNTLAQALSVFKTVNPGPIAIESDNLTVNESLKIKASYPNIDLQPADSLIETLRLKKDQSEIASIQKASLITSQVMNEMISLIKTKPNLTEKQVAVEIERRLVDTGADGLAFPIIVAFDHHSASPHHIPNNTPLSAESVVLLDFGCQYNGYASDMTRTIKLGKSSRRFQEIETIVTNAYQAAVTRLSSHFSIDVLTSEKKVTHKASIATHTSAPTTSSVDKAARNLITQAGFGPNFIHTTGHGLGLEIHEAPSINSHNHHLLEPGMVVTLEPGIYLPNMFGYRYENTLLLQ
jgi:Xaa-Pro aminopeptidase